MLPFLNIYILLSIILITVDSIPNSQLFPSIIVRFLSYKSLKTWIDWVGDTWQNILALGATIGL